MTFQERRDAAVTLFLMAGIGLTLQALAFKLAGWAMNVHFMVKAGL